MFPVRGNSAKHHPHGFQLLCEAKQVLFIPSFNALCGYSRPCWRPYRVLISFIYCWIKSLLAHCRATGRDVWGWGREWLCNYVLGWFTFQLFPLFIGFQGYSRDIFLADQHGTSHFPEKDCYRLFKLAFLADLHATHAKSINSVMAKCENVLIQSPSIGTYNFNVPINSISTQSCY